VQEVDEQTLVQLALRHGAPTIVSTYNEPLITSDWARRIFEPARDAGLLTGYVSNGNATPEVLDFLQPAIDLFKVDLKTFSDRRYRELGGVLKHVLETIESLVARGIWVEVVTLLVPDFNNSDAELKELTGFLAGVSPDIPWHVTAFHPDYHMTGPRRTMASDLQRAYEIGRESGLRYVYAGNIAGGVGDGENTRCPDCNAMLVERLGFRVRECRVTSEGTCPDCGTSVPGVWTSPRASQKA
jgi:pyruvate formate lyase activating enzyme